MHLVQKQAVGPESLLPAEIFKAQLSKPFPADVHKRPATQPLMTLDGEFRRRIHQTLKHQGSSASV